MIRHTIYRFDGFQVDPDTFSLTRDGREAHLEPVVLKLLIYLISHRHRPVTRQELMDTVWGDTVISEAALSKAADQGAFEIPSLAAQPDFDVLYRDSRFAELLTGAGLQPRPPLPAD